MKSLKGVFTALVTPFKNGSIDYPSLTRLVESQLRMGIEGFIVHGTTGESPTLTMEEKKNVFKHIQNIVSNQKIPLIVGTGTNSTLSSIENSKKAQDWGADALLLVTPYYNKPPQRGLVEHFKMVSRAVQIPSILYNVPGRTVISLSLESIYELSKEPSIVGIKEASGQVDWATLMRRNCRTGFILLSGDDPSYVPFVQAGGDGVISVVSHIIGNEMVEWQKTLREGKTVQTSRFNKLIQMMGLEANPIPVKMALYQRGIIDSPELRLPLVSLNEAATKQLHDEMQITGLIA